MLSTHREPPNKSIHPPRPPPPPPPLPMSFSSLPEDIILSCLARISKSYYPRLSLISNSYRWLLRSDKLYKTRTQLNTREECVYLSLQSPTGLMWFSLWIKPDHQTLSQCTIQEKSTGNLLVPVPSSYSRDLPNIMHQLVGSEFYVFVGQYSSSSSVLAYNPLTTERTREVSSMTVAREDAVTWVLDGKIYVMGGCSAHESISYLEVFDPKTQTWESLPDPGPEVRFCSNKKLDPMPGKIVVKTKKNFVRSQKIKKKNFVYLVKENRWEVDRELPVKSWCVIENVLYKECEWYDTKSQEWKLVNGLSGLDAYSMNDTEIGTYGGKLVMFWDTIPDLSQLDQTKKIWCAMITLDKSHDGEVWGQIEWVDRCYAHSPYFIYTLDLCELIEMINVLLVGLTFFILFSITHTF